MWTLTKRRRQTTDRTDALAEGPGQDDGGQTADRCRGDQDDDDGPLVLGGQEHARAGQHRPGYDAEHRGQGGHPEVDGQLSLTEMMRHHQPEQRQHERGAGSQCDHFGRRRGGVAEREGEEPCGADSRRTKQNDTAHAANW